MHATFQQLVSMTMRTERVQRSVLLLVDFQQGTTFSGVTVKKRSKKINMAKFVMLHNQS